MRKVIYEIYSFESNEWVECDKYEYDKTQDKYRRTSELPESSSPSHNDIVKEMERLKETIRGYLKFVEVDDLTKSEYNTFWELRNRLYEFGIQP